MGGPCSTFEGKQKIHIEFWWGNLGERYHSKYPGLVWWIILK